MPRQNVHTLFMSNAQPLQHSSGAKLADPQDTCYSNTLFLTLSPTLDDGDYSSQILSSQPEIQTSASVTPIFQQAWTSTPISSVSRQAQISTPASPSDMSCDTPVDDS